MRTIMLGILMLALTASVASAQAEPSSEQGGSKPLMILAEEVVDFLWPATVPCPGPDDDDSRLCFNQKADGEDLAISAQALTPELPGFTFESTTTAMEARLVCNGEPLTVISSADNGTLVEWFSFERRYVGPPWDTHVSGGGVTIPNGPTEEHAGQLLACGQWPYEFDRVEDGKTLLVTLETRAGSSFDLALLIPPHWADGDLDDNRVVEEPPDGEEPPGTGGCDVIFTDVPCDHLFHTDVEWLAETGITRGCNPPDNTLFCPGDFVTRGQMAAFLVRGLELPSIPYDEYSTYADVSSTHVFFDEIGVLGANDITRGCNPPDNDRFCPEENVTRGQMAAFLTRAFGLTGGHFSFADTAGHVFEQDVSALAEAGITRGCNPPDNDRFCPDDPVTRGQMAAFLHRALGQ